VKTIDLTPFGFTPTESLVYTTLLRIGPTTGYGVALASRLARANAYAALEGLVTRGAATRASPPTRPVRYRPTDPQALLAQLATLQGEALDRLSRALRDASHPGEPATKEVAGARAVANLILQLVARAGRVDGVLSAELWRPTLPAWRHASREGGAKVDLRIAGDIPAGAESIAQGSVPADAPTTLLFDDAQVVVTAGTGDAVAGVWSSHPLIVVLARRALGRT
jgi:sugar-specific transcriptional regulator TrmB